MNKQQLATKIWEAANKMRSKIEANEYKDYILGFIFYKYLSDNEVKFLKQNDFDDESLKDISEIDSETVEYVQNNIGYFIDYKNLFSTWLEMGRDFDASNVTDALNAFDRLISKSHTKVFKNIFVTLGTGLSKLGENSGARTKAIKDLLNLIKDIPMDGKQDYDVLGYIYEYLIEKFASNAGKKAGEFYTPHEVSVLMSEIVANHLQAKTEVKIYDPTSGSGSLLINIGKSLSKYVSKEDNIKYYAQELKENTYNLTRMNLVMRGIKPYNITTRNADTLEDDWPLFDDNDPINSYEHLLVDAVVSNPPYSQEWNPQNKESDPRYSEYGLAPKTKADFAFLLHDLYHVNNDGIMTIVLPHGVLFRGGEEGEIRKNLIEKGHVDAIIGLPPNIFFGTGIPTIIMVLKQFRKNSDTLIIDASKNFIKDGKNNKLRASDIKRIVDAVKERHDIPKYAKLVTKEQIRANEYNLNIPRYVDSSEQTVEHDIYATMFGGVPKTEVESLSNFWQVFPTVLDELFTNKDEPYLQINAQNIKETILQNKEVIDFEKRYKTIFNNFETELFEQLITNALTVKVARQEEEIANNIFARLQKIELIDKYEAYQILDDHWQQISNDLELIQTEGFNATKQVDPNLVIKKDAEVQDGWQGHIIPFELVQKTLLKDDLDKLQAKENRMQEILSLYDELLEEFTEDEKDLCSEQFNDNNTAFVFKTISKKIAELKKEIVQNEKTLQNDDSEIKIILEKLIKVETLNAEEKSLKKQIKTDSEALHAKTKTTIENLSTEQVNELLHLKWVEPLCNELLTLPKTIVTNLVTKITEIATKYQDTLINIDQEILQTSKDFGQLVDQLTGDKFDIKGLQELKNLLIG